MKKIDVTNLVEYEGPDDECLPITKCVCGQKFRAWDFIISIYKEDPYECPKCGAKLYFANSIHVYQTVEE